MIIRGSGLLRNLHNHEKIHEDNAHNNVAPEPHEGGKAHVLTVEGQDYLMRKHGGPLSGDPFSMGFMVTSSMLMVNLLDPFCTLNLGTR